MKMKLYEFGPTRSIRVRWTLQELGVDFDPIRVNLLAGEHRRPDFLKINPAGKIPVLVDGDLVLTESVAIVLYLAEKYAERGLLPAGIEARAQVNDGDHHAAQVEHAQHVGRGLRDPGDGRPAADFLQAQDVDAVHLSAQRKGQHLTGGACGAPIHLRFSVHLVGIGGPGVRRRTCVTFCCMAHRGTPLKHPGRAADKGCDRGRQSPPALPGWFS